MQPSPPDTRTEPSSTARHWRTRLLGLIGLLLALVTCYRLAMVGIKDGNDFGTFYAAAQRYLHGENPYITQGDPLRLEEAKQPGAPPIAVAAYGNPPLMTAILAGVAWLDYEEAQILFTLLSFSLFIGGFWLALEAFAPHWAPEIRLLLMAILLQSVSVRWIMGQLQTTVPVMGALGIFLYAALRRNPTMLVWSGVLASLKPTLFLPVLALLLFRRQWRLLALILVLAGLLNLLAMLPTGVRATIAGYRLAVGNFNAPGTNNYPDVHESLWPYQNRKPLPMQALPGTAFPEANGYIGEQLSWTYMFSGSVSSVKAAGKIAAVCSVLALGGLGLLWWRTRKMTIEDQFVRYLFCLSISLTLLCVYHQRYDAVLLLYPLTFMLAEKPRPAPIASWLIAALCACVAILYTASLWDRWLLTVAPGNHTSLVPLRAYGITAILLLQFWQIGRYIKSGLSSPETKASPEPQHEDRSL